MVNITREEILKLGKMANISIDEDEIPELVKALQGVLSYAAHLKDVAAQHTSEPMPKHSNIMRDDEVIPTPAEPLLALAPEREDNFFVVPKILKN